MNFLALVNRLKVEAGRSGGAVGDVVSATGDDARLVNWINDAWLELQRRPHGWTWMRAELSGFSVVGTNDYGAEDFDFWRVSFTAGSAEYEAGDTLTQGIVTATIKRVVLTSGAWLDGDAAGEFIITPVAGVFEAGAATGDGACTLAGPATSPGTFDRWVPPTIEGYAVLVENEAGEKWRLRQMAWDRFRGASGQEFEYERWWRPLVYWAISPDERLYIAPTPEEVFTLRASYYIKPTSFALNSDEPTFDGQYHLILVWRALMELASFDAAPEVYARAQMNFANLDREMRRRYGPIANHGLSYF